MRAVETLFVILLVCSSCGDNPAPPPPGTYAIQVQDTGGASETLHVELARTPDERRTGLMNRQSLPADGGMLFIFSGRSQGGFWMKNTYVPLDIAYLGQDGRIQEIREGVPLSEVILTPDEPYYYVLEVNKGWFEDHGFSVGDRVVIPAEVLGQVEASRAPPG